MGNHFLLSPACLDEHCRVKQAVLTLLDLYKRVMRSAMYSGRPKETFSARFNERELLWADGQDGIGIQTLVKHWQVVAWDEAQCFTSLQHTLLCIF